MPSASPRRGRSAGAEMNRSSGATTRAAENAAVLMMVVLSLGIHLAVNALARYGYFRDELYYIACSKRLAFGYVDQPPFSIYALAVARSFFGESVFALCLLVRRMGGGRLAMVLASLCFMASAQLLGHHTYYSMNSFDILFW